MFLLLTIHWRSQVSAIELFQEHWRAATEIGVLWLLIYQIFRVFRSTRGARILIGLAVVVIVLTLASQLLELKVIEWIIKSAAAILAFGLLIIFQPELRNALARLGSTNFFSFSTRHQQEFLDALADAVVELSNKRFGALFAIERNISLENYESTGVTIDAQLSVELVTTIFHPKTSLHDGGMVLSQERVEAAGCIFPVSQKELSDRALGLRHRAGFGVSEDTDAVAIVVSEETGAISILVDGKMLRDLSEADFRKKLEDIFLSHGQSSEEMVREELDVENGSSGSGDRDLVSD